MLKVSKNNTEYVHREQSWLHTWRPEAVSYNLNLLTSGILKSRLFLCEMPGIADSGDYGRPVAASVAQNEATPVARRHTAPLERRGA